MILAIDIGGTKVAGALFQSDGQMQAVRQTTSVVHSDLGSLVNYIASVFTEEINQADVISLACTGLVRKDDVNFLSAGQTLPVRKALSELVGKPVLITNDASAAAWAEYHHYSQQSPLPSDSMVYITVSTGVGGGIIQNGKLVTADNGFCSHLGHVSVSIDADIKVPCHCGRINCVEAIASGTAISRHASSLIGAVVSTKAVFEKHQLVCQPVIKQAQQAIADMIASVFAVTGAETFVLGGSVGRRSDFHQGVVNYLSGLPATPYEINVLTASCDANADLIGAYLIASAKKGSEW